MRDSRHAFVESFNELRLKISKGFVIFEYLYESRECLGKLCFEPLQGLRFSFCLSAEINFILMQSWCISGIHFDKIMHQRIFGDFARIETRVVLGKAYRNQAQHDRVVGIGFMATSEISRTTFNLSELHGYMAKLQDFWEYFGRDYLTIWHLIITHGLQL